jgi:glucokinase
MNYANDQRTVLTLDAGGTNFVFSAIRGNEEVVSPVRLPANANDLQLCLETIVSGFRQVKSMLKDKPVAISFAFPGPSDYENGIIGDLGNLPAFRGGVALGPMLEELFGIPVYLNNDGDLFVYGEAIAGLLPEINTKLKNAGSPKQYKNLFGITLGTGFGAGIVRNNELFIGDNGAAGEIWLIRNKLNNKTFAEEGASIRAIQNAYYRQTSFKYEIQLTPKDIFNIAEGTLLGDQEAAINSFREMGEVVGDALANAITLIDGLIVIGGGLSGAATQFLPHIVNEMNSTIENLKGDKLARLESIVFNLEDQDSFNKFIKGENKLISVPGTNKQIPYDPLKRIGIGLSKMGTSKAVAIGAYAYALYKIDIL